MRYPQHVSWLILCGCFLWHTTGTAQIQEVGLSLHYFDYTTELSGWNPTRQIDRFPQLLGLNYSRQLTPFLALHFPIKLGKTPYYPGAGGEKATPVWFVHFDTKVKLEWYPHAPRLSPYVCLGAGAYWLSESDNRGLHWRIPMGLGLNVKAWDRLYFFVETNYYRSLSGNEGYFSHGVGLRYRFGKSIRRRVPEVDVHIGQVPDSDGDGISDKEDQCPHRPGPARRKGCPDSTSVATAQPISPLPARDADHDGVPDSIDRCPRVFGSVFNYGCPEDSAVVVADLKSKASPPPDTATVIQQQEQKDAHPPTLSDEMFAPNPREQSDTLYQRIVITDTLYRTVTVYDTVVKTVIVYDTVYKTVHIEKPPSQNRKDHTVARVDKLPKTERPKEKGKTIGQNQPSHRSISESHTAKVLDTPLEKGVISTTTLRFPYRVAALQKSHLPHLYEIVRQMKAHPEYRLVLLPHSTDYKHPYYDELLTKKRLSAIVKYMKLKGINAERIEVRQIEEHRSSRRAGWVRLWLKKT